MKTSTLAAVGLAVLAGACGRQDATNAQGRAAAAAAPQGDWPTYGGPLAGDRYSPLSQITAANVASLREVCAFDAIWLDAHMHAFGFFRPYTTDRGSLSP